MRKFIISCCTFSIIIPIFIIYYIIEDPYKIIHNYKDYYKNSYITLNRDYITTRHFLKTHKEYKHNAYILGNSRSFFWRSESWIKHIGTGNTPYHFNAMGDDVYGIYQKLELINKENGKIDYALIILDSQSFNTNPERTYPQYNRPCEINPNTNLIKEHFKFIQSFYTPRFFTAYIDYKIFKKKRIAYTHIFEYIVWKYNYLSNEIQMSETDSIINTSPEQFYTEEKIKIFFDRDTTNTIEEKQVIDKTAKEYLKKIKAILVTHNTNYKIIINPLYNAKKIASEDLTILNSVFGEECVYNFSGWNKFTRDYKNYYETSHYRPHIADSIMNIIYNTPTTSEDKY